MRARSPGRSSNSPPPPSPGAWRRRPAWPCGDASSLPSSPSASRPCTPRWRRSAAVAPVRKWLWWALQLAVAGVVARMVWDAVVKNWSEFRAVHLVLALRLAVAGLVSIATIGFLAWDRAARAVARLAGSADEFRPLPLAAVAESAGLSLASWITYGVAFWLLARGLGLPSALPLARAAGVFALGYILGLLALFAPGGVGGREVVLVGLLTPALGAGGGVRRSGGSRILLTVTEVVAPLCALLVTRDVREDVSVRT